MKAYSENGWLVDRLKDIAEINAISLGVDTPDDFEFSYLEISNVDYYGIVSKDAIERICFEDAPSRARRRVRAHDVLVSSVRPNLQAIAHIDNDIDGELICSTGFNVVTPNPVKIIDRFLYYYILSEGNRQHFEAIAKGVGYPALDDKDFEATDIPLPPIPEQKRIAAYLDASCAVIDRSVEIKQKQLETLDALRKSIIQKAVTQGLNPDVEVRDSGALHFRQIPRHWKVDRLKDLTSKIGSGVTPRGGAASYIVEGIPLIRSQNVHFDGVVFDDIAFIDEATHAQMSNSQLTKGDVLLNITGASIGRCAVLPETVEIGNVNQHVCILRSWGKLRPQFLNYFLISDAGQSQVFAGFTGSSREGLNFRQIGQFKVPLPDPQEQQAIVDRLDQQVSEFRRLTNCITDQITTLTAYRKSLIHECVTGKRRISGADVAEVEAHV
ncbi:MAG: restriction endonuclease subunit S [Calditrichaceae bacterium]|nr:restriction endonuclease subunit S [Calditrichia bacterium]NUQ40634.1 restriction endonuclease subunit S [Calditrichaceae bacterium]